MDRLKSLFSGATSEDSDTNPVIEVVGGENQSLCPSLSQGFYTFFLCFVASFTFLSNSSNFQARALIELSLRV